MDIDETPTGTTDAVETVTVKADEAPKSKAPKLSKVEAQAPKTEVPAGVTIHLSAFAEVCGNTKNSESVRWVQRRLIELGHYSAGSDLPGWLCEGTAEALAEYQAKAKVKADSERDRAVIESLMKGTPAKVAE